MTFLSFFFIRTEKSIFSSFEKGTSIKIVAKNPKNKLRHTIPRYKGKIFAEL